MSSRQYTPKGLGDMVPAIYAKQLAKSATVSPESRSDRN
jgi:hypothetical protein